MQITIKWRSPYESRLDYSQHNYSMSVPRTFSMQTGSLDFCLSVILRVGSSAEN